MRRIFALLLILLLCFALVANVGAAEYDYEEEQTETTQAEDSLTKEIIIAVVLGIVLSFLIPMSILKGQLKTVRQQAAAADYVRPNSMNLTSKRDIFLYRRVVRTEIPKQDNNRK